MNLRKVLGANTKALRESHGWSQERLAEVSGLHRTYVSGVERGVRNVTVDIIEKLAKALSVSPSDMLASSPKQESFSPGASN